ncbi:MAG: hypothetical protein V2J14_05175 [Erythrobacter sp.]|nr:hypothetical protein [Erythrobacter sp.]
MNGAAFAILALVPLMAGTSPSSGDADAITVALCNGGTISIDLGDRDERERDDCHPKGCHAGACREKPKKGAIRIS